MFGYCLPKPHKLCMNVNDKEDYVKVMIYISITSGHFIVPLNSMSDNKI